ncbi:MAG: transposase [Candidatus Marinimicrobia bacterium]|nr:transposase [Candidatus Neomarinimicrobiota bacterium]
MILYAGIDPSSRSLTLAVVDSKGEIIFKPKNFSNSPSGADEIENTLPSLCSSFNASEILVRRISLIGIESTSFYDWHIANSIASSSTLSQFSIRVFRLSPYKIYRFRKSTREVNKNDSNDAISIADYLRLDRSLPHPHVPADPYMPLRQLCRYHCHLVNTIASQTNVLLNHLFLQHLALVQNKAFKPLTSATSFSFFEEFLTPEDVASTTPEELVSFLVKNSKNRFPDPHKIAQTLKAVSRESYRIRPELASSNHFIIAQLIHNIRTLKQSLKQVNKAIKEELKAFPNTPYLHPRYR